jgi:DNA adenine methylase
LVVSSIPTGVLPLRPGNSGVRDTNLAALPKKMGSLMPSPIKIHGGKSYLADWIVSLMPPRCKNPNDPDPNDPGYLHYVEPYFGGGSVLLANDPNGISEVANDIDWNLTLFWLTLQSPSGFLEMQRRLSVTPFSQTEFESAVANLEKEKKGEVDFASCRTHCQTAIDFFIVCRQSLSGRKASFAPRSRNRTRKDMNEQVAAWMSAVDGLSEVAERMRRVVVLNRPAIEVIFKEDGPRTLFYLDPPYLHETRNATKVYDHEMSTEEHTELLEALSKIRGRFMLSGYRSNLYDTYARDNKWVRHEKSISNHASGAKKKRTMTECVWCNF